MVVGQDVALVVDEHAGSQAPQLLLELLRWLWTVEKEMKKRVVAERHHGVGDFPALGDVDVNHGRYVLWATGRWP
jgi:hypothetical protein